jgi:hypothetical protein
MTVSTHTRPRWPVIVLVISAIALLLTVIGHPSQEIGLLILIAFGLGLVVAALGGWRRQSPSQIDHSSRAAPFVAILTVVVILLLLLFATRTWTH